MRENLRRPHHPTLKYYSHMHSLSVYPWGSGDNVGDTGSADPDASMDCHDLGGAWTLSELLPLIWWQVHQGTCSVTALCVEQTLENRKGFCARSEVPQTFCVVIIHPKVEDSHPLIAKRVEYSVENEMEVLLCLGKERQKDFLTERVLFHRHN